MRAAAASASWPSPSNLSCSFSTTTLRYSFTYAGSAFTGISFNSEATAALFGFTGAFVGSASIVTAQLPPMYCIATELDGVSTPAVGDGIDYMPQGISVGSIATMGQRFGITRGCVPTYRDWVQQSEPRAKVLRMAAWAAWSDTGWFSHQELFEHCRSVHPFVVVQGFGDGYDYLFRLRADSCIWSSAAVRRAASEMDDAHFDVFYRTQTLGVFPNELG